MENKSSWKGIHWEGAHGGNSKPKNPKPKPHNPIPLMGHSLPFHSSKTQTEAPLRKMLKNMKIAGGAIRKQLLALQIGIYIENQFCTIPKLFFAKQTGSCTQGLP